MDMIWNDKKDSDVKTLHPFAQWGNAPALPFHHGMPDYKVTPLTALPKLAEKLGISQMWVKDESFRFGLNAFKGLGCSYAIGKFLCEQANIPVDKDAVTRLRSPEIRKTLGQYTFITATDGNHGRGVAWAAKLLGHRAVIYMPEGTKAERFANIQALNAQVHILPFNYDDAVRAAAASAEENGWVLVQDTAWEGYKEIPTHIMEGYTTLAYEIEQQLIHYRGQLPTHVFLQAGVGSMAGAISAYFKERWGNDCPVIVVVEPDQADCHFQTAKAGDNQLHTISGKMNSMMAGLCCGEPNPISWEILEQCATAFVSCSDDCAAKGMKILGRPQTEDTAIVSGESGAVTTGVLAELLENPRYRDYRDKLGLHKDSRVLVISTEGDTDRENYQNILRT